MLQRQSKLEHFKSGMEETSLLKPSSRNKETVSARSLPFERVTRVDILPSKNNTPGKTNIEPALVITLTLHRTSVGKSYWGKYEMATNPVA